MAPAVKLEWTPSLDAAFERAATEKRVVLLALGEVGEGRSEQHLKDYVERRSLPSCRHYFDPTKVDDNRECGLHTGL